VLGLVVVVWIGDGMCWLNMTAMSLMVVVWSATVFLTRGESGELSREEEKEEQRGWTPRPMPVPVSAPQTQQEGTVLNAGFVFSVVNINVNATMTTTAQIVAIRIISVDLRFIPSND
jgi:hypothetical protein